MKGFAAGITACSVLLGMSLNPANAQCPRTGADTTCGSVITITDSGSSISFTGQGPYDGNDDTLVGVINKSSIPIFAMGLSSRSDIFGFDGDGLTTYGTPGNTGAGSYGYGGPGVTYSNIKAGNTSGVVNFSTPIASNGGTAYFSLENALSKPTAIEDLINNSIQVSLGGRFDGTGFGILNLFRPTNISATFIPNNGLTLAQAAQTTGFTGFDFQQTITNWPSPDLFQVGNPTPITAPPGFLDPPLGGYTYCIGYFPACLTSYPFYPTTKTASEIDFFDSPRDPLLPSGSTLDFTTDLIGILPGFQPGTDCIHLATPTCVDLGVGFDWISTYNGSLGGIAITASNQPIDPATADGLGGIMLKDIRELTTYAPFSVTTVNGIPVVTLPTDLATTDVPEPASLALLGFSVSGFIFTATRRRNRRSREGEG